MFEAVCGLAFCKPGTFSIASMQEHLLAELHVLVKACWAQRELRRPSADELAARLQKLANLV
jgi:hypothetical protein